MAIVDMGLLVTDSAACSSRKRRETSTVRNLYLETALPTRAFRRKQGLLIRSRLPASERRLCAALGASEGCTRGVHRDNYASVGVAVWRQRGGVKRVKAAAGTYPVHANLHQIKVVTSPYLFLLLIGSARNLYPFSLPVCLPPIPQCCCA